jgi:hypothetical protein
VEGVAYDLEEQRLGVYDMSVPDYDVLALSGDLGYESPAGLDAPSLVH